MSGERSISFEMTDKRKSRQSNPVVVYPAAFPGEIDAMKAHYVIGGLCLSGVRLPEPYGLYRVVCSIVS